MAMQNKYLVLTLRLILGLTFLVSSIGKFVDIRQYSVAMVYNFDILPGPIAIAFGWALPFIEFACAMCLLLGILTRLSALGVALMGISFLITKIILLSRGPDIECGCFGAIGSTMASWSIYLDPAIVLIGLAIGFSGDDNRHFCSLGNRLSQETRRRFRLIW